MRGGTRSGGSVVRLIRGRYPAWKVLRAREIATGRTRNEDLADDDSEKARGHDIYTNEGVPKRRPVTLIKVPCRFQHAHVWCDPPRWGVRPGWAGERDFDFRDMRDFEISGLSTDVNRGKNTDHI